MYFYLISEYVPVFFIAYSQSYVLVWQEGSGFPTTVYVFCLLSQLSVQLNVFTNQSFLVLYDKLHGELNSISSGSAFFLE